MNSAETAPPRQASRGMRKHRILTAAGAAAVVSVAVPVAACAAPGQARSAPTVTVTAAAAPAATATVTQPAPEPTSTAPDSAPPDNTAPESTAPSAAGSPQIIATFNDSGNQNTGSFTVPGTWHLSWAYWGCPNPPANFQVSEYNTDGSPDFNGVNVNELGSGRGPVATTAYGDGGSHYFQVSTEGCSWSLVAVSGQG